MGGPIVYADLTFLVNLIMDFLILWATGKLAGIKIVYYRIFSAAVLGGIYAVGYLFSQLSWWYNFPLKIIFSCLLIFTAFWPISWENLKKCFLYFYGISFITAGATIGFSYLFNSRTTASFSYLWLLGGIFSVLFIGFWGGEFFQERIVPGLLQYKVKLRFGENICSGKGFLDTGNSLHDPLTNRPVVIAEYKLLGKILPDDFKHAIENIKNESEILEAITGTSWAHRLRLIPFTSIGRRNGLLIGVRADEITVDLGKRTFCHKNLVVGIYRHSLSSNGDYQLLIPSEILKKV